MESDRMSEEFYQATSRRDYDGNGKYFTKDCVGCDYYRRVIIETRLNRFPPSKSVIRRRDQERCYWGVAWKVLGDGWKMKKCGEIGGKSPRKAAFDYLDGRGIGELKSSKVVRRVEFGGKD